VKTVRVVIEYGKDGAGYPSMRWEREAPAEHAGTFEALGRAFEVAQREEGANFTEALRAFFRGAVIGKADVEEVLKGMA